VQVALAERAAGGPIAGPPKQLESALALGAALEEPMQIERAIAMNAASASSPPVRLLLTRCPAIPCSFRSVP
jgi:hypothetical protein